jgi:signal transduction histidine kinase
MSFVTSARTRLVIASGILSSLVTALVLALVYWTAFHLIDSESRQVVDAELKGLAESYSDLGILGLSRAIDRRVETSEKPDAVYLLTNRFGQPLAGNLGEWPSDVEPGSGWVEIELIRTDTDRVVPIAAASIRLRGSERLLVGRDASAKNSFAVALWRAALLSLVAAILLSLVIGWLLTRIVFSRIGEISKTAGEIMSGDLSRRMLRRDGENELDQLAQTLNAMLDRIEELVSNLRMTTDSLSHDLRSPLTRLRAQIEQLAHTDLPEDERLAVSGRAVQEIDHILSVFSGLTEIARAEAGIGRANFEMIDLASLISGLASLYQPLAEERQVTLCIESKPASISGNKALLEQAVSNLLENALRYAPTGSEIHLSSHTEGDHARVCVSDHGKGIPEADQTRVVKAFVTLEPSRTDGSSGLGLALVASVMRLHGGAISLEDNAPGLKVHLTFPTSSKAQ